MSGLVRTYSPRSRVQSRCSRVLSPSWVAARTSRPSAGEGGQLVVGERLGRREVEHAGAALAAARRASRADRGQRGQLVGQRLARRRAGGEHDVAARRARRRRRRPGAATAARPPRAANAVADVGRRPSRASRRSAAARGGSTSRWRSRSSRPGTAVSRVDERGDQRVRSRSGRRAGRRRRRHGAAVWQTDDRQRAGWHPPRRSPTGMEMPAPGTPAQSPSVV